MGRSGLPAGRPITATNSHHSTSSVVVQYVHQRTAFVRPARITLPIETRRWGTSIRTRSREVLAADAMKSVPVMR